MTTTMTTTTSSPTFLCSFLSSKPLAPKSSLYLPQLHKPQKVHNAFSSTHRCSPKPLVPKHNHANSRTLLCYGARRKPTALATSSSVEEGDDNLRRVLQIALWVAEGVYILWLFLLPYAPGDPVWVISSDTINSLVGLSLNFFFILPFMNFVGIRLIEAPVLHPMSEGLFNFVIGWTFMFAPLLFTDRKRDRYKGSLDVLWGLQMFLTNTFLIPYMAIRLNDADDESVPSKRSQLGSVMTNGAPFVGLIGGSACLISLLWALFGRTDANFGGIEDRWEFLVGAENLRIYGSYDQVLEDPGVDAVYVPLPTSLHLQWAVTAAKKKKHVLVEKPAAVDVAELDRILEACESNGVQFMDGSMWLHHPRTAHMEHLLSDSVSHSRSIGPVHFIHSSSTMPTTPEFLESNIRVKPDLNALGALGDLGWYCIGASLWAKGYQLPTTITALPDITRNAAGVILSITASLQWDQPNQTVATIHCSFLSHSSMDLAICGSNGSLHLKDFIIPYQETSASFDFTFGAKFVDLHIGWNVRPEEVHVATKFPQEALMVQELARLVASIRDGGSRPSTKWPEITRKTQLVVDAVKKSLELGCKPVGL